MPKDDRDLLEVLKFELEFLKAGGYGRSPRTPWRPQFIFEDSPTCLNFNTSAEPAPCSDCLLMQFVPSERCSEKVPCRHIPLNEAGQTIQALYEQGTQQETEEALESWLSATIQQLEQNRVVGKSAQVAAS
jgi:hypothetical protein